MRPEILNKLFSPTTKLQGIGPKLAQLIEKIAGPKIVDLIFHIPSGIIDRRFSPPINTAPPGRIATFLVKVISHKPGATARQPYRVLCVNDSGEITLTFFHAEKDWLLKSLPIGEERAISGKVEYYNDRPQISHPDYILPPQEIDHLKTIEPVYPLTTGLSSKVLLRAIREALTTCLPHPAEWLNETLVHQHGWPSWTEALKFVHAPQSEADLSPMTKARQRLAYDELLASQIALQLSRNHRVKVPSRIINGSGHLQKKARVSLPFKLTSSQEQAIAEILADMANGVRMLRLLQGDVGSGKTAVAAITMIAAVEAGVQTALMAPTEILARQHYKTIAPIAKAAGVSVEVLTSRDKGKTKDRILTALAKGEVDIIIGTHALVQETVSFKDLGMAIIDEQHRFGVHQRLILRNKGENIHTLVMTATPIPRTLLLASYGDMEVSRLTEKPLGRKPITTRAIPLNRMEEVITALQRTLSTGSRIYWVCPLVEESELIDLAAAEDRYRSLAEVFGDKVGLIHGRMKPAKKDNIMAAFRSGGLSLLVATTVIEVGVDVPEATVMVIEHADRFGLAQLHQLRGRIGRSDKSSTCLLLYDAKAGAMARARLKIMRETEDGFRIAEEDLRLRGGGEILGTRQSGIPDFRLADLSVHNDLLAMAQKDAKFIVHGQSVDIEQRKEILRPLLYLFERDAALRFLKSG
ncbi:MAG: ATP-dependent DNA helicase RecG [Alphaproteobacteria bacterium]